MTETSVPLHIVEMMMKNLNDTFQRTLEEQNRRMDHVEKKNEKLMLMIIKQQKGESSKKKVAGIVHKHSDNSSDDSDSDDTDRKSRKKEREEDIISPEGMNYIKTAQKAFKERRPNDWKTIKRKKDYNPLMFAFDGDNVPHYVGGMTLTAISRQRIMYSEAILADLTNSQIRSRIDRDNCIAAPLFVQTLPYLEKRGIKTAKIFKSISRPMNADRLRRMIHTADINSRTVGIDPRFEMDANTVQAHSRDGEIFTDIKGLKGIRKEMLKARIEEDRWIVTGKLKNVNEFQMKVLGKLQETMNLDVQNIYEGGRKPLYSVILDYVAPDGRVDRIPYLNAIEDIKIMPQRIEGTMSDLVSAIYGSDVQDETEFYLDLSRFTIQRLIITRSGGSLTTDISILTKIMVNDSSNRHNREASLGWCRVVSMYSKANACFVKILYTVSKDNGRDIFGKKSYITFQKELDRQLEISTVNDPIEIRVADRMAKIMGFSLEVYELNESNGGVITHRSRSKGDILRVLLYQGHYLYIKKLEENVEKPAKSLDEDDIMDNFKDKTLNKMLCFFDLETVYNPEITSISSLIPYSNGYLITKNLDLLGNNIDVNMTEIEKRVRIVLPERPSAKDIFEPMIRSIIRKWNRTSSCNVTAIAYNGASFDFILLFGYLARNGYRVMNAPHSSGKLRSMKVLLDSERSGNTRYWLTMSVWDPFLFITMSLSDSAKAFKLDLGKGNLNHEEVQRLYSSIVIDGDNMSFREELLKQGLEDYNRRDVSVLFALTIKLVTTLKNSLGENPMEYSTLPGMAYKLWQKSQIEYVPYRRRKAVTTIALKECRAAKYRYLDDLIRKSIVAGRVQCKPGSSTGKPLAMYDVVSMYPTVMMKCEYPIGDLHTAYTADEAYKVLSKGYICFLFCNVDQSPLDRAGKMAILPRRGDTLDWNDYSLQERIWISSIDYDCLTRHGASVEILDSDEVDEDEESDPCCIYWREKSYSFKSYIEMAKKIKEDQDKLVGTESYNATLRHIGKLLLNAVSGKVGQRNFIEKSALVQNTTDFDNVMSILADNEDMLATVSYNSMLGAEIGFINYKDETYYRKPKPAQNACCIWSYARTLLYDSVLSRVSRDRIYYMDTDSVVIHQSDSKKFRELIVTDPVNKQFGMFELEKEFDEIIAIAPKTYCLIKKNRGETQDEDTFEVVKHRIKGVRKDDLVYVGDMTTEDPEELWNNDRDNWSSLTVDALPIYDKLSSNLSVIIRSWQFVRNIRDGILEHRFLFKTISPAKFE